MLRLFGDVESLRNRAVHINHAPAHRPHRVLLIIKVSEIHMWSWHTYDPGGW